jgi:hypothetical protein
VAASGAVHGQTTSLVTVLFGVISSEDCERRSAVTSQSELPTFRARLPTLSSRPTFALGISS